MSESTNVTPTQMETESHSESHFWYASSLETQRTEKTPIPPPPEAENVWFDAEEDRFGAGNTEPDLMDTLDSRDTTGEAHRSDEQRSKQPREGHEEDSALAHKRVAIAGPNQDTLDDMRDRKEYSRKKALSMKDELAKLRSQNKLYCDKLGIYQKKLGTADKTETQLAEQVLQSENTMDQLTQTFEATRNQLELCKTQMESDRRQLENIQKSNEEMMRAINAMREEHKQDKAHYEQERVDHAREKAEHANEVLALRERIRVASSTQTQQARTPATPRQQERSRVFRSEGASVGIVPLRPPTTPSNPRTNPATEASPTVDLNAGTNHSPQTVENIVKETLRQLSVNQVSASKASSRRPSSARTRHRKTLETEKGKISKAHDLLWKEQVRTAWKQYFDMASITEFAHYNPAPKQVVEDFETGPNGPDQSNTLDFNRGYEKSRWNKVIISRFYDQLLIDRETDGTWGIPDVSKEYLIALFYNQLKRCRETWAQVQHRPNLEEGRMETHEDVATRVANYEEDRNRVVTSRSHREQKYQRRVKTVDNVIVLKTESDAPDLEAWKFFCELLTRLSTNGMSSEDEGAKKLGDFTIPVFRVKICPWRNPSITNYFKYVDKESQSLAIRGKQGSHLQPRVYTEELGSGEAPKGLSRSLYDPAWLSHEEEIRGAEWVEHELRVSKDVFEMLEFIATV